MQTENTHERLELNASGLPWGPGDAAGIRSKLLGRAPGGPGTQTTRLLALDPGVALPLGPTGSIRELLVLEGELHSARGSLGREGFARFQEDGPAPFAGPSGCTLFVKEQPASATEAPIWLDSAAEPWLPGQGNLRVKPLGPSSALVHWPANERFVPHRHWGGEEVFVLSGTFRDEHGSYPAGTWLLSPHLSQHHPFVIEETVIYVQTGHLRIPG